MSLCWSGDGRRVARCAYCDGARVWDAAQETGETTLVLFKLESNNVQAVVYSPDETMITAAGSSGKEAIGLIKIFDANTGRLVINLGPGTGSVLPDLARGRKVIQWRNYDMEYNHLVTDCSFKCVMGQDSPIVEPRERPAHQFASPSSTLRELPIIFSRWKSTSNRWLGQQCIYMGC
jgi:WD40 repeat protein